MTEFDFALFLRHVVVSEGSVMSDGTSYFFSEDQTLNALKTMGSDSELSRLLVLTSNGYTVVGGVGFYGSFDFQIYVFSEYRHQGYMSAVCKNGILKSILYPKQRVTLVKSALYCVDDVDSKLHLLDLLGLVPANIDEVKEQRERLFSDGLIHRLDGISTRAISSSVLFDCKTLFKTCPGSIVNRLELSLDATTDYVILDSDEKRIGVLTIKIDTKGKRYIDADSVVSLDFFEDDSDYACSQWHVICSAVYTLAVDFNRRFGVRYFQSGNLSDFNMIDVLCNIEKYEYDRFKAIANHLNVIHVEEIFFGDDWEAISEINNSGAPFCLVL